MHRKDDDDGNVYTMKLDGNNPLKIVFLCLCVACVLCSHHWLVKGKQMENANIKYCVYKKSWNKKEYPNS